MKKKELGELIDLAYRRAGNKATVIFADKLKDLGYEFATRAGISIGIKDMVIPPQKDELLDEATTEVREIEDQYNKGLITDGERYNKVVDIWAEVTDRIADEMLRELGTESCTDDEGQRSQRVAELQPDLHDGRLGRPRLAQQIRQLAGMRGLMAKPSGEIIETPITANFREGLTVLQYFISTHGARKGLADTALKTANSGYLTRRLVDVAQDSIITEQDCGTLDGIEMTPLVEGGEIIEGLGDRVLGRVALEDIRDPVQRRRHRHAPTTRSTRRWSTAIEEAGLERVKIRSVLTCQSRQGVCGRCYGRDLARGHMVNLGRGDRRHRGAVDRRAGHAAHDAHLPHRRHREPARRADDARGPQRRHGQVHQPHRPSTDNEGDLVVMNRNGELAIVDVPEAGRERERERYPIVYGAKLKKHDGAKVKARRSDRRVGSVHPPDPHRGGRRGEVRRHPRRRHHGGAGRRAHRPLDQGRHRHQGRRQAAPHLASRTPRATRSGSRTATRRATCCPSAST